jgi:actin-like ATPase involved in cell morphogenesis
VAILPDPLLSRAVLIGTSIYEYLENLPAVRNNLSGFRDALLDPARGGLRADRCTIIQEPTSSLAVFEALKSEAEAAEDTLLVYFAGHGKADFRNELYLCLPGTAADPDLLWGNSLPYNQLRGAVAQSRAAKKVVILDCCFSGRAVTGYMSGDEAITGELGIEGTYILTATKANIRAEARQGERYTAFTGVLLELLRDGIPDAPELLTVARIFQNLKSTLISRRLPEPDQNNNGTIADLALTRNAAYGRTAAARPSAEKPRADRGAVPETGAASDTGRGTDLETEATLSPADAERGTVIQVRLPGEDPCDACRGTGSSSGTASRACPACQGAGQTSRSLGGFTVSRRCRTCQGRGTLADDPCPACSGSGRTSATRTLMARIPAGVRDGQRVRLRGRGERGRDGDPDGDLYIRVHVQAARDEQRPDTGPATAARKAQPDRHIWHRPAGGPAVCFDLGMTNSVVAVLDGGMPVAIPNAEGSLTTPSAVAFGRDGEVMVGVVAKRQVVTNQGRTVQSVKGQLGTDWTIKVDRKRFTASQISAFILQKLKRDAEAALSERINDAVLTAPAYFTDRQRQAIAQAGEIAGLNVLRIINEPTSAALAYHLEEQDGARVLVFTLGGGTFDVSVLTVREGVVEVQATSGDSRLGGKEWDQRIMYRLMADFKQAFGIDLSTNLLAQQRLLDASEEAKIELSGAAQTEIHRPYIAASDQGLLHLDARLTRADFQKMTSDLLRRCRGPFEQAIADAGVRLGDIDHVVLVGGSTRMPAVVGLVRELADGRKLRDGIAPDTVVAMGGALQAGVLKSVQ